MTEEDGSNEEPDQIKDPEAYVNQRRLQQLFDLRESLHEKQLKIVELESNRSDKGVRWNALNAYRSLVNSYIMELEPIMRRYKSGPELLNKRDFGTVTVRPVYKNKPSGRGLNQKLSVHEPSATSSNNYNGYVRVHSQPNELTEYQLKGLVSVLELPSPLTAEYTFRKYSHTARGESFTHTASVQIGAVTLRNMVRTANSFLADIGFTVEPEPEDNPAMI